LADRAPDLWAAGWTAWQGLSNTVVETMSGGRVVLFRRADGPAVVLGRGRPADGRNLVISLILSAAPLPGHPPDLPRRVQVEVGGGETVLWNSTPSDLTTTIRGGREQPRDPASGGAVSWRPRLESGGTAMSGLLVHPPFRGVKGAVHWFADVDVPPSHLPELRFSLSLADRARDKSDGVWVRVDVADLHGGSPVAWTNLHQALAPAGGWQSHCVGLAGWSGRRVRLRFTADCGPSDNATADHLQVGGAKVVDVVGGVTKGKRFTLWVVPTPFISHLYVRPVGSQTVDVKISGRGRRAGDDSCGGRPGVAGRRGAAV